jgi:hypothetical protein
LRRLSIRSSWRGEPWGHAVEASDDIWRFVDLSALGKWAGEEVSDGRLEGGCERLQPALPRHRPLAAFVARYLVRVDPPVAELDHPGDEILLLQAVITT